MEKQREYFKNLLAEHEPEQLFDELFALLNWHKARYADKHIAEKYDALILISGKLNNAQQGFQIGTITSDELNAEVGRVNAALLDWLNALPDAFFDAAREAGAAPVAGVRKVYAIPSGLRTGLFWMASMFILMVALGSLVLKNWLTFGFTLLAALISMPPVFDYFSYRYKFALSGSLRVLLVLALTTVGLLFASPQKKTPGAGPAVPPASAPQ